MSKSLVKLTFPKLGHFWFDSGLVGMKKILEEIDAEVTIRQDENELIVEGTKDNVQKMLESACENLVNRYYDISTQKQKEDVKSYNFYYDSNTDKFVAFPKKKSCGIAEIIYNKAPRPTGLSIKWQYKDNKKTEINYKGKKLKRTLAKLPPSHAHLQDRMDDFLNEHEINITTSGLLVDGPNAVKPKIKIDVASDMKKIKGYCFFCGQPSGTLEEASQTTFPLITGSSGILCFNSMAQNPEKVCWKCSLLGKFVPANGFYYTSGENIFAFFPYSSSLFKMIDSYAPLHEAEYQEPNYYRNFGPSIKGYFYHVYEITFVFLYTLYKKVLIQQKGGDDEASILDWQQFYNIIIDKSPLEFYTMHARKEGNTFSIKSLRSFRETVYFYKLLEHIEECGINIQEVISLLVDYEQKNENSTLVRNRIFQRVLNKKSILDLLESFVYSGEKRYIKPLADFLYCYEPIIRKGDSMTREEQETAVTLGRRVGTAVGKSDNGKRGDLFALRKARKKVDFLEQLNRLQFKLGKELIIPSDVYEGKLTDDNFTEFKQFCMIAALNSYNVATSESKK